MLYLRLLYPAVIEEMEKSEEPATNTLLLSSSFVIATLEHRDLPDDISVAFYSISGIVQIFSSSHKSIN